MTSKPTTYHPGQWILIGTALGAFIGLLLGKFAIGLIAGFFIGLFIDANKRKASKAVNEGQTDHDVKD